MKAGAIAVVKNEADIIESFVRHNLDHVDRLFVVDNGSTDGTVDILEALVAEGLALTLTHEPGSDHPQSRVIAEVLVTLEQDLDWVFLLDADELIEPVGSAPLAQTLATLDPRYCHTARWEFFVPTAADDPTEVDPVRRIRRRRLGSVDPWLSKAIVPRRYLGDSGISVSAGNHSIRGPHGRFLHHQECTQVRLGHFPIRSAAQLRAKAVVGDWAISSRVLRGPGEGHHWSEIAEKVLARSALDPATLTSLASNYGSWADARDHDLEDRPLAGRPHPLRYPPPAEEPYPSVALEFAREHFGALRRTALRSGRTVVTKTPHGLVAHRGEGPIAEALERYGEWVPLQTDFLLSLVGSGATVVDLGAGCGQFSLAAGHRVGSRGRVIAVEDSPGSFPFLCTTAVLNDLPWLAPQNSWDRQDRAAGPVDLIRFGSDQQLGAAVPWLRDLTVPSTPVVVLDVPASESTRQAVEVLRRAGYKGWWHLEPVGRADNFAGASTGSADHRHLVAILLPPGSEEPGLVPLTGWDDDAAGIWQAQGARPFRPPVIWVPDLDDDQD